MELKCVIAVATSRHDNDEEAASVLYKGTSYCGKHFRDLLDKLNIHRSEENLLEFGIGEAPHVRYEIRGVPEEEL